MCLSRHFRTFAPLRTPPHKTQTNTQNDLQTVRFCNGLGRLPSLGFLESPSRLNPSAFKSTFSSMRSRVCLNPPFRGPGKHSPPVRAECVQTDISVHLKLCVPHPTKRKKVTKATTKPSVFAMVWEGIQTLGFRNILERLARWSPKMSLSKHFRVCDAECV